MAIDNATYRRQGQCMIVIDQHSLDFRYGAASGPGHCSWWEQGPCEVTQDIGFFQSFLSSS